MRIIERYVSQVTVLSDTRWIVAGAIVHRDANTHSYEFKGTLHSGARLFFASAFGLRGGLGLSVVARLLFSSVSPHSLVV